MHIELSLLSGNIHAYIDYPKIVLKIVSEGSTVVISTSYNKATELLDNLSRIIEEFERIDPRTTGDRV